MACFNLPVMPTEDGTKVQQHIQDGSQTDCLKGCVAPIDQDGMPNISLIFQLLNEMTRIVRSKLKKRIRVSITGYSNAP